MAETGDIFAGLLLAAGGAVVGIVVGLLSVVGLGPGPRSLPAAIFAAGIGVLVGAVAAFLTTWNALHLAARSRWLRKRLTTVWLAYEFGAAAVVAAVVVVVVSRI